MSQYVSDQTGPVIEIYLWSVSTHWEWPAHLTLTLSSCSERRWTERFDRDVLETLIVLIQKVCAVVGVAKGDSFCPLFFLSFHKIFTNLSKQTTLGVQKLLIDNVYVMFLCKRYCICWILGLSLYIFTVYLCCTQLQNTFTPSSIQRETALFFPDFLLKFNTKYTLNLYSSPLGKVIAFSVAIRLFFLRFCKSIFTWNGCTDFGRVNVTATSLTVEHIIKAFVMNQKLHSGQRKKEGGHFFWLLN